ncbi:DUF2971 domain-containing protein [Leptospira mtsangambouensis]|uniref:DUF2971 domain-containing protein n=1 Tax=Leptospira mtsangambouensis TaxID=2484912 RepID=UPI001EEBC2E5|nr:DUF2971 domain-containing protein [Leptospira mtsangambouensis]MCG6142827.1 DUF2971 domain-containing protein [Leptospira mtsangambouensis]
MGYATFLSVTLLALQEDAPTLTPAPQAQLRGTSSPLVRYAKGTKYMHINNIVQTILDENLKRKRKQLYHYTTADGLLGIKTNKSFHLSEHQFLNDMDELKYGSLIAQINLYDLLNEEYNRAIEKKEIDSKDIDFLNKILDKVKNNEKFLKLGNYYIGCFSEIGDDLGQWKGYSNFGEGFSIKFDMEKFLSKKTENYIYSQVVYDKKKQSTIIKTLVKNILNYYNQNKEHERKEVIINTGAQLIFLTSTFFKSPKFSNEREWRLLYTNPFLNNKEISYKSGRFGIHSYHPFQFDINCINEIIIGPKYDFVLNFNSLNLLFNNKVTIKRANLRIK